jgi:uncharacterized membrane protein YfcA
MTFWLERISAVFHSASFIYSLSGLVVGFVIGLTGVGGGSLMTPLLLALGFHPTTAVGTDLIYAAITKSIGTVAQHAGGTVDWKLVRRLAYGSVPATAVTLFVLSQTSSQSHLLGEVIKFVLGIALLLTAISIFFRGYLMALMDRVYGDLSDKRIAALTVFSGALVGVLVSLSSVGAGAIGVTALILLYPKLPLARIVGADIAHGVPITLVAGIGYWYRGDVNWALLAALLTGSIPGILAGSMLAPRMPEYGLRPALAAILLFVGINSVMHAHLF